MKQLLLAFAILILAGSCSSHTYYIVRHAEKGTTPPSDPPLTEAGLQRAERLKELLKDKNIAHVYSTNYKRTLSTAKPLADAMGLTTVAYDPRKDSLLVAQLKALKKNALVVGHSNTIDDIVNKLCGSTKVAADIDESVYDNLFVVKFKGKKIFFEARKY